MVLPQAPVCKYRILSLPDKHKEFLPVYWQCSNTRFDSPLTFHKLPNQAGAVFALQLSVLSAHTLLWFLLFLFASTQLKQNQQSSMLPIQL